MDSVQVGRAVFVKESYTTLGIEPRTYSYPGRLVTILVSVGLWSERGWTPGGLQMDSRMQFTANLTKP